MNRNVVLLALAHALMMSVNTLLLTSAAIIGKDLTSHQALATLPLALQFLAIMITTIPASLLMQRIGRKNGFLIASMIGISGGLICLMAIVQASFWLFCLGTICIGIYTGFGNYFRFTAAEVSAPERKNTAISYVLAGGVIAAVLGPNLANYSKDLLSLTYVGSFISVILLYALNLVNFLCMKLPKPQKVETHEKTRPLSEIARQPVYLVAVVSAAIGYSIMVLLMTATPLAMTHLEHRFSDVAFVIQWHVLAMYLPSFFTGHLINRFSAAKIILCGAFFMLLCVMINLNGSTVTHFWLALMTLGLGWNFMFIGGTTMLTETYTPGESAKAQALNDFIIFSMVAFSSFGAGALHYLLGWQLVNYSVIPFILVSLAAMLWLSQQQLRLRSEVKG